MTVTCPVFAADQTANAIEIAAGKSARSALA
jgi:hypothetical protein